MKKPRQFLPLLKQMLGFYRVGPIPLLLWFLSCGIILYFSGLYAPAGWASAHGAANFVEEQVGLAVALWFFLMLVSTPLPVLMLGGSTSLEFLFTRAIDRAVWLRAERTAIIIIAVSPLVINLALSPWEPKLVFDPAAPDSVAAKIQARYISAFPGSQLTDNQLVIRQGRELFATWLVWSALIAIFLVAGYFTLVFRAWQRAGWHHSKSRWRPWLGAAMIYAPAFSVVLFFIFCTALRINFVEESFLLFARHPVSLVLALIVLIMVVQPWSERNLKKLEFEFS